MWAAFFMAGALTPEKRRNICSFSFLPSPLCRPLWLPSALASACGAWSICWRAMARTTVRCVPDWKGQAQVEGLKKSRILENWYFDGWNEGVTPRSVHTDTPTGIGAQPPIVRSSVKSAERCRSSGRKVRAESCPEVDGASDMPGVSRPWLVCMEILTNFWMYKSKRWYHRNGGTPYMEVFVDE